MKKQKNGMKFYWFAFLIFIAVPNISHSQDADYHKQVVKGAYEVSANAQSNLAGMYSFGEVVVKDFEQANTSCGADYQQTLEKAYLSNGRAQNIGLTHDKEKCISQDASYRLTLKKAPSGDAMAQFNLARMYDKGEIVTQDYEDAVYWYRKAADQGHAKAQTNLGSMYATGTGVFEDNLQATYWYRRAAAQGNLYAKFNLGLYDPEYRR